MRKIPKSVFYLIHAVPHSRWEPTPDAEESPARRRYDTDLTDAQWGVLAPLIPEARSGGRPRKATSRELVDAILYFLRALA